MHIMTIHIIVIVVILCGHQNGSDRVHVQVMLDGGCDDVLLYDDGHNASLAVMGRVLLIRAVTACPLMMAELDYPLMMVEMDCIDIW